MDFTITGLRPGSTVLDIEAPRLGGVAGLDPDQQDLWLQQPDVDDTALDLAALAISEAQNAEASGDRFDSSVLEAILELGNAARTEGVRYELVPCTPGGSRFVLEDAACPRIRERISLIPAPSAAVVSGQLDEIGHDQGRFRLLLGKHGTLPGRLDRTVLDVETLRPLWGRQATVEGLVHFKSNGQPRLIEARRITTRAAQDAIFEKLPISIASGPRTHTTQPVAKRLRHVDPMILWGAWPGDDSIEELLAELD
ncbi:hypothetical protein [Candidatus Palauibacter sp.]|uniref:hypothetical protein n=1 Tax=Candidatus Palauibacter sp. TaxID=3101350 RepID=UPI003C6FF779